ncbi:MAG TPA: hypothetical protein VIT44_02230 [Cyclobacteriaceae bacterium]
MEKIKTFVTSNYPFLTSVWAIFTILLFLYFAEFKSLKQEELLKQDMRASKKGNFQPWTAEAIELTNENSKVGFYENISTEELAYLKGWGFSEASRNIGHDSVYFVLESPEKKRLISPVYPFGTSDVVEYYKRPELNQVGFEIAVDKTNLAGGIHRTALVFKDKQTGENSIVWLDFNIIINILRNPKQITEMPMSSADLNFALHDVVSNGNSLNIVGWAFPKTAPCSTCAAYFILRSPSASYKIAAHITARPDVSNYFNNPALLYSGLVSNFSTTNVLKNSYKLGILLSDTINQIDHFVETERLIHINRGEFSDLEEITFLPSKGDSVRAFVDTVLDQDGIIEINGWAFLNNISSDSTETFLVLKSEDALYSASTIPSLRPDLKSFFKLSYNVDLAGFTCKLNKSELEKGDYQVCVVMLNKKNNSKSIQCLDTTVKIEWF